VFLCLAAAACAGLPESFTRIDSRQVDLQKLVTDQAICRDEIKKDLSTGNQTTTWGPTDDAKIVYTGCMVQQGYKVK